MGWAKMRLIDVEQLSKHKYVGVEHDRLDTGIPASAVNVLAYKWGWNDALDSVERFAPIVDVVKIVRCKDCKYYNLQHHYCEGIGNWFGIEDKWGANDYCSKGERKEDETVHG